MSEETKKKPMGMIINIIVSLCVVGGIGYFLYSKMTGPPDDPVLLAQMTPEGALKVYLETADSFIHGTQDFFKLEKCVVKEDYQWFQDNWNGLFKDDINVRGGVDPTTGDAIARITVMTTILKRGAVRQDCEIMSSSVSGDTARFVVWQLAEENSRVELPIDLVKVGRYWKVKNFSGGKDSITNPSGRTSRYIEEKDLAAERAKMGKSAPAGAQASAPAQSSSSSSSAQPSMNDFGFGPSNTAAPSAPAANQSAGSTTAAAAGNQTGFPGEAQSNTTGGFPASQPNTSSGGFPVASQSGTTGGFPASQPNQSTNQAPAVSQQPASLDANTAIAQVDKLITEANAAWKSGNKQESLNKANQALDICLKNLGANHQKTIQVQNMVNAAKGQVNK